MLSRSVQESSRLNDAEVIHDPDVHLAIWTRDLAPCLKLELKDNSQHVDYEFKWLVYAQAIPTLHQRIQNIWGVSLAADVSALARFYLKLRDAYRVAIRLESVRDDACKKFHADYKKIRLISTYAGPGTEWIYAGAPENILRLKAGDVGFFKGRRLMDEREPLVLHRSPPIEGQGLKRLLLVIDEAEGTEEGYELISHSV